ncbi:MAG: hypothetical protein GKR94_30920 [Gammaproteobacteria bacterium]|nr:hypothetical protein [Gammaproteobacteria bacterium]
MNETLWQAHERLLNAAQRVGTIAITNQTRATRQHALFLHKFAAAANRQMALISECTHPAEYFGKASEAHCETGQELARLAWETLELHAALNGSLASAVQQELTAAFGNKAA